MSALSTGRAQAFPATRWSIVARAAAETDATRRRALEDICRAYWFPLYAFARSRGEAPHDAEDLTQGFFARVLQTDFFAQAKEERGKLRTFLLAAFTRHLANTHRDAGRQKRGGGQHLISIDLELAEGRLQDELAGGVPVELLFDKRWALAVVATAMQDVEADCARRGKPGHFTALRHFLDGTDDDESYARAAEALAIGIPAVRQEVYRLRQRLREHLRRAVADTLHSPTPAEIDAELAELKQILRG